MQRKRAKNHLAPIASKPAPDENEPTHKSEASRLNKELTRTTVNKEVLVKLSKA